MEETEPFLHNESPAPIFDNYEETDDEIVDFDSKRDLENPLNWPKNYKWGIVALLAFMAFTVTFTCISVVPVASHIVADLSNGHTSRSASILLVTVWELGEAVGPILIAPLSEIFGRFLVMNVANVLFILTTVIAAISQNVPLLIIARGLTGAAVASNVLNPAIVGDMFVSEERGSAMSFIQFAPLIGGAAGPAIAGAIAQSLGWRSVLWMSAALATVCEVAFLFYFRETFKVLIIRRKAARLRQETGNGSLRTVYDSDAEKESRQLWIAVMRPFYVFSDSSILQWVSLFHSMVFSFFYVMSTSLPDLLQESYHLSPAVTGSTFISYSVGSFLTVIVCNAALDKIFIRLRDRNNDLGLPEFRLPLVVLGGFALPIVVVMYGWTAQAVAPLALLLLSVGLLGAASMLGFVPLFAYVVDAFGVYSASAMTALIVTRCLMGTFIPLIAGPLVISLGYGWGYTVLAVASLCLAPLPIFILRHGSKWRQHSRYTKIEIDARVD